MFYIPFFLFCIALRNQWPHGRMAAWPHPKTQTQPGNMSFPITQPYPTIRHPYWKITCLCCATPCLFAHPGGDALPHALLEGGAEGAVAVVAAFLSQLLGNDGLMCSCNFAVAGYEVTDAEVVYVCIVACALTGEILAKIVSHNILL